MSAKKFIAIAISGIVFFFIALSVNKYYKKWVFSKQKMYCYETYDSGVMNSVLYVEYQRETDSLIKYYKEMENGNMTPTFNFPPLTLPTDTCVYVMEYLKDSTIAKIVCYYDWKKRGNFVKGYVYSKTLHNSPPADSLISD